MTIPSGLGHKALRAAGLVCALMFGVVIWIFVPRSGVPETPQDREVTQIAPRQKVSVVAFGTSLTNRPGWVEALASNLRNCTGPEMEVLRLSRSGAGSVWAIRQLDALAAMRPDIILMEFAINDADLHDGVSLSESRQLTTRIISGIRVKIPEAQVVLMTMNPVRGIVGIVRRPRLSDYYQSYRDLAAEQDTGLVDFAARWGAAGASAADIPDGLHPTSAASSAMMADVLTTYLAHATGSADCKS